MENTPVGKVCLSTCGFYSLLVFLQKPADIVGLYCDHQRSSSSPDLNLQFQLSVQTFVWRFLVFPQRFHVPFDLLIAGKYHPSDFYC